MAVMLRLFGEPFVERDGERLSIPFRKAEAVLFYVALEGPASRERLKFLFWGDKDEPQAASSLRNALYLLRKTLPVNFEADRQSVRLRNTATDLDCLKAIETPEGPIPPLFFTEPLEGLDTLGVAEFGEWLAAARETLKKRVEESLRARISACYEAEMPEALAESLSALLVLDPFDEGLVLELMELHKNAGDVPKAVALYRIYAERLKSKLNLLPGERAERFFAKLVSSAPPGPSELFCCRESETARIADALSRNPHALLPILIHGEAGVGKSALVAHMLKHMKVPGTEIFTARPLPVGEKYPYSSWSGIIAHMKIMLEEREVTLEPLAVSVLSGAFYEFMKREALPCPIDITPEPRQSPAIHGKLLADLTERLCAKNRAVFVFEDLHLFDSHSLELVRAFLSQIRTPLTVFLTSRPEGSASALELLRGVASFLSCEILEIALAPFCPDDVARFCRSFLPGNVVERRGKNYFVDRSEGLPLLLTEMAKMLWENPESDCAAGLKGLILGRMEELSGLQREVLSVLSVFGGEAPLDEIAAVMETAQQDLIAPVAELLNKRWVRELQDAERCPVDFLHANVRECVYGALPGFKRKNLHAGIAKVLNRRYSPRVWNPALGAALCHHYTEAGEKPRVLRQHLREMGFHIALNHVLFPLVRDSVLLTCSVPYSSREDTEQRMEKVRALLAEVGDAGGTARSDLASMEAAYFELYGGYLINWGDYRKGKLFAERALKLAGAHDLDETRLYCLEHLGHLCLQVDDAEGLYVSAHRIARLAKTLGREKHVGQALRFIGMSRLIRKDFGAAERAFRRSIEIFEELGLTGRPYTLNLLASRCYIAEMRQWTGDPDAAAKDFEYCIDRCEQAGLFWGRSHFHAHAADAALDKGDWEAVRCHIETGVKLFESSRGGHCGSILYSLKAICDARQGRAEDALQSLRNADFLSAIGKKTWCAAQHMAKAWIGRMLEAGKLAPAPFDGYFDKTPYEYALEAASLYRQIGAENRAVFVEKRTAF